MFKKALGIQAKVKIKTIKTHDIVPLFLREIFVQFCWLILVRENSLSINVTHFRVDSPSLAFNSSHNLYRLTNSSIGIGKNVNIVERIALYTDSVLSTALSLHECCQIFLTDAITRGVSQTPSKMVQTLRLVIVDA